MKSNKIIYWALIGTFTALYLAVAFVSTLHAITFFQLANTIELAILLGAAYEIGQASVLFSILMTENKNRGLAWGMMFLLTALQVTANVYASFKFMDQSGTTDWTYWQRAILFGVDASDPETYKVIISWISGALLPLVALGMTALVAENIRLARGEELSKPIEKEPEEEDKPLFGNLFKRKNKEKKVEKETSLPPPELRESDEVKFPNDGVDTPTPDLTSESAMKLAYESIHPQIETDDSIQKVKEEFDRLSIANQKHGKLNFPTSSGIIKEPIEIDLDPKPKSEVPPAPLIDKERVDKIIKEIESPGEPVIDKIAKGVKPVNKVRGWHFFDEYVDNDHNVFQKGKFIGNHPSKTPTSKKA